MHFEGSGHTLFVVLTVVFIVGGYMADYQTFLRQHYDNPRSNVGNRYCNTMMQRRGMTQRECKAINSFIHAPKKKIIAVCDTGGQPYRNGLRRSNKQFLVTTCKRSKVSPHPPCKYRENRSPRFIVVACQGGKPIHYEEGQIKDEYMFDMPHAKNNYTTFSLSSTEIFSLDWKSMGSI